MLAPACRWIGPASSPDLARLPLPQRVYGARVGSSVDPGSGLAPAMTDLHDPSLLPGVDIAAQRLLQAIRDRETIAIYGDYDVDGVTACAILKRTIAALDPDARVLTYIPHRVDEGYGVNADALQALAAQGARVIVTVDCGVTAVAEALRARELGVDLIITDHHTPPASVEELPEATAIVHPALPGGAGAHPDLAGAGVAHKLAWRLATLASDSDRATPPLRQLLVELLALAALGTIADVAPLTDDNRVIARFGLRAMRCTSIVGLNALIEASGLADDNIDEERVGFILGPRLNAVGRLGHAREALELLLTQDADRARDIARSLTRVNDQRRNVERAIFEQADELACAQGMTGAGHRAIVLASEGWHPGVVGIVCSRLVQKHTRPALLLCRENGACRGSGRSIHALNLHEALSQCAEHLESFGGHAMAAGLALSASRFDDFAGAFLALADQRLTPEDLQPSLRIDCQASLDELTRPAVETLLELGPFGAGNPRPTLLVQGARLSAPPRVMGASGAHLALSLHARTGKSVRVVGWSMGARAADLRQGMRLDVVISPKLNRWTGSVRVEGEVRDMQERK